MTIRLRIDDRAGPFDPNPIVLGRAPEAHWDLGLDVGPRRHATLEIRADWSVWIRSLEPLPGTYTLRNGIPTADSVRVRPEDRIELGPFPPWCRAGAQAPFVIRVEIEGLDAEGRAPKADAPDVLVPLPRHDTSPELSASIRPPRPGSILLTAATIDRLHDLETVAGDLRLRGLNGVELLTAPALDRVGGDLRVEGCAGLRRVELPRLHAVEGRLVLDALPDLEEVWLPNLREAGALTVRGTEWLCALSFPALGVVAEDISIIDNALLGYVGLPRLSRVARVRLRINDVLPQEVVEGIRIDFLRRRVDGVVDAADNGRDRFEDVVRRRLLGFDAAASHASFERFVRVAPELIEVHERMLQDAERDGDRRAAIERLRRLLELAMAQADDREDEYDRALKHLLEPTDDPQVEAWRGRLASVRGRGPLRGEAALLWTAELSAALEHPREEDVDALVARWRRRAAVALLAPQLAQAGLHGVAARVATRPAEPEASFWLWATLYGLMVHGWRPGRMPAVQASVVAFGRLMHTATLEAAAAAFVALARASAPEPGPAWSIERAEVGVVARAAGEWLIEDLRV